MFKGEIEQMPVENLIFGPFDIRTDMGDIAQLKLSIESVGIKDPLTVSPNPEKPGTYNVLDGNRRLKVAQNLGLKTVPVINLGNLSVDEQYRIALITNIVRKNLSAKDLSTAVRKYKELNPTKSEETIAMECGIPAKKVRSYIYLTNLAPFISVAPSGKRDRAIKRDDEISEIMATDLARVTTNRFPKNEKARIEVQEELLKRTEDLPSKLRHTVIQNYGKAKLSDSIAKIKEETMKNIHYNFSVAVSAEINNATNRFMRDNGKDKSTAIRLLILEGLKHFGYMSQ